MDANGRKNIEKGAHDKVMHFRKVMKDTFLWGNMKARGRKHGG